MSDLDIKKLFPSVLENIKVGDITTFGIGGKIAYMLVVEDEKEIVDALRKVIENKIPYHVISGGSNIVFPDGEIKKLVIKIENRNIKIDATNVSCGAGTQLSVLVRESARAGLAGLESLTKIPGSVGGAIYGNAGAYGASISDCFKSVTIFDGERLINLDKNECGFGYRESIFKRKEWIIVTAEFELRRCDRHKLQEKRKEIITMRSNKYKKGIKCPGSYFKNIIADELSDDVLNKIDKNKIIHGKVPAGYLLESVGACGMIHGGIEVASFHGNLLINKGNATYRDMQEIVAILKKKVREKFGIELEEEVIVFK